jgi:hypothetical protein
MPSQSQLQSHSWSPVDVAGGGLSCPGLKGGCVGSVKRAVEGRRTTERCARLPQLGAAESPACSSGSDTNPLNFWRHILRELSHLKVRPRPRGVATGIAIARQGGSLEYRSPLKVACENLARSLVSFDDCLFGVRELGVSQEPLLV